MVKPRAIVLTGFGINCDNETERAFQLAGADPRRVHLQDVIDAKQRLKDYQIVAIPGGFSFGDDVASGKVFAVKLKTYLGEQIREFVNQGRLIGICNGAQIAIKFGLLPEFDNDYENQKATLTYNDSSRFECRWVRMKGQGDKCIFTQGIPDIELPVAHGEGRFLTRDRKVLERLYEQNQVVFKYADGRGELANGRYPYNPNGSVDDIAAICDTTGRLMIMMPHPERYLTPYHHPQWQRQRTEGRLPKEGQGLKIFKNAVRYFS